MIGQNLEVTLNRAVKLANQFRHEYLTLECLLLSLIEDQQVAEIIKDCGGDIVELEKELLEFIDGQNHFSILSTEEIQNLGKFQFQNEEVRKLALENGISYQPELSFSLQRVIQRAALHVQSSGKNDIKGINVLVAIYSEKKSHAVYLLEKQDLTRFKIVEKISHGIDQPLSVEESFEEEAKSAPKKGSAPGKLSPLEAFTVDLIKSAKKGEIDPLIGRKKELHRIVQILCRRRKNNPLLTGDAGVGKTALAQGLALAVVEENVPELLKDLKVYSLDLASLMAGTKYRGDFEQRFKSLMRELDKKSEKGPCLLFIDEIHTIMGAGSTSGGSMDASNLLKPSLTGGKVKVMGSTTFDEYRKFVEKDAAFSRRFQKVDVLEPTADETVKILMGLREKYEQFHAVSYPPSALKAAANLSAKHMHDRRLPDKAIDIIDEVGARNRLLPGSKRKSKITVHDIEDVVSQLARIPKKTLSGSEKEKIKYLEKDLKLKIFGQDEAIDKVVTAIMLAKSGLGSADKPIASFLFAGPTGVGKTELAISLSQNLGIDFERFDMSEYMEKHSVSKLIGAPPGYVGFEQGGGLTEAVNKNPHCVLLLDEIEKAHPDIFNVLLQVMDHGVLTDSNGREVDFRNVILIYTTNAGARELEAGNIGLSASSKSFGSTKRDGAIKNTFSPEFRNRLDAIVHFNKLEKIAIDRVVNKFLVELEVMLTEKKVELDVDLETRNWIAESAFDPKLGARPIKRFIEQKIKHTLASELLFGSLIKGGKVKISMKNGELDFKYT